jgi:hypothetical protein
MTMGILSECNSRGPVLALSHSRQTLIQTS